MSYSICSSAHQIKELQLRVSELPKGGRKHGGLERRQRGLELRRDQSEGLVLDAEQVVSLDGRGNQLRRDREQPLGVEESGKKHFIN